MIVVAETSQLRVHRDNFKSLNVEEECREFFFSRKNTLSATCFLKIRKTKKWTLLHMKTCFGNARSIMGIVKRCLLIFCFLAQSREG